MLAPLSPEPQPVAMRAATLQPGWEPIALGPFVASNPFGGYFVGMDCAWDPEQQMVRMTDIDGMRDRAFKCDAPPVEVPPSRVTITTTDGTVLFLVPLDGTYASHYVDLSPGATTEQVQARAREYAVGPRGAW